MNVSTIESTEVARAFASYPDEIREELLNLRRLILETAEETPGVGTVEESLKWGQPSYRPSEPKIGSSVRIAPTPKDDRYDFAMFFICHTNLVSDFKALFGDTFAYDGERALLFRVGDPVPRNAVAQCVEMALTYHLTKQSEPKVVASGP